MTENQDLSAILEAAIASVNPYLAVEKALQDNLPAIQAAKHVYVVGCGKAVVPMALALEDGLGEMLTDGLVVTKYGHLCDRTTSRISIVEAAHPIPDQQGVEATEAIIGLLQKAGEEDVVIALISGGGSALWVSPPQSISLEDKMRVSKHLLQSGASIEEMNAIRKHLSCIKGGHAARHAYPAKVLAFLISDVVGDPLDVIASGPFAPDSSTFHDAVSSIAKYRLEKQMPLSVMDYLHRGCEGLIEDTPKQDNPLFGTFKPNAVKHFICSANRFAVEAAKNTAESLGYEVHLWPEPLVGEAALAAQAFVKRLLSLKKDKPLCLIAGGETTVTLGDATGKGGRNQEFALVAARHCAGQPVWVASLGTDGNDGPTDAAGAYVGGDAWAKTKALGFEVKNELKNHNAYPVLQAMGALLMTGPTNTNVADIQVGLYP